MYVDVDLRRLFVKLRGIPEYECRINLITNNGSFHATDVGIGAAQAVSEALAGLEIQIEKKLDKRMNRKTIRKEVPFVLEEN